MNRNYSLGKLACSSTIFSGYILTLVGIATVYFSLTSIFLILLGGFLAFTGSNTSIDSETCSIKMTLLVVGIIPITKIYPLQSDDNFSMKRYKASYTTRSLSNRENSVNLDEYRIYLEQKSSKKKYLVGRFDSQAKATEEYNWLCELVPATDH